MYRAFELKICEDILQEEWFSRCTMAGKKKIQSEVDDIKAVLQKVVVNGTIEGTELIEQYFPVFRRDVFLSYSHNDQDLAYMVAGLLNQCFGLSVFIDSMFWGGADKILREIDNKYCLKKDGVTYSYEKRNLSTSHVHAMLSSAIMKAMDQAEIIIFLNTSNSVPHIEEVINRKESDEYTLSPWIYEEILFTSMLRETDWQEYRCSRRIDECVTEQFENSLKIAYKIPKKKLIPLGIEDIENWADAYEKRKNGDQGRYGRIFLENWKQVKHPLNVLYELKCGVDSEKE